jgi:hypothetical protein
MNRPAIIAMAIAAGAFASHARADEWTGEDKTLHAIGGAAIGLAMAAQTGSAWAGFRWGCGVGAAKELFDAAGQGTPSAKDLIVTCAAAGLGSAVGKRVFARPTNRGAELILYMQF